jgi:hypothetical protein
MKKKEAYVAEHPEERRLVYRAKKNDTAGGSKDADAPRPLPQARNLFDKNGLPRRPERSIYYDPVMNPYGVAPPGMPYMERRKLISSCMICITLILEQHYSQVRSGAATKGKTKRVGRFHLYWI